MWGAGRFGSLATTWLALAAKRVGIDVTVIAHELFTPFLARPDLMLGAVLNRAQIMGIAKAADRLLVSTDTRVEELMPFWRLGGLPARPGVLRIGPNSLPVGRYRAAGRRRLGFFSTFAITKRFDVVLGAFEHVWRRWPDSELVLIGDIGGRDNRHVASIYRAIERHPGRDRIRVTGKLSLEGVARQIADLDIYLFPMTTGANTRSGTLPVALGSALPVVALNGTETDLELFRDRENVLFAKSMTADAFASSALQILEDPELAERISIGARRLYDDHLSWSRIGGALMAALGLQSTALAARMQEIGSPPRAPEADLTRAQNAVGPVGGDRIVAR
jgi:glycosyltransferase involved in cell wall biosynthesis